MGNFQSNNAYPIVTGAGDGQDEELQLAIAASMSNKGAHDVNVEPIPQLDKRMRESDQPTGLRNIGNTCYFNSLLQVYYSLPNYVERILTFEVDEELLAQPAQPQDGANPGPESAAGSGQDSLELKLVKSGMKLVRELQWLFTRMATGKVKYLNPSGVLESVVDDQGDRLTIGEEKDISEYNATLLQRIQDAFDY